MGGLAASGGSSTAGASTTAYCAGAAISETLGQDGKAQTTASTINSTISIQATMRRWAG